MTPVESNGETIAAISTPPGEGAISLVRISGRAAIAIADEIFRGQKKPSEFQSHLQHFGEVIDGVRVIDQVMLSVHRAPRSYTGEDLVEISGHGGVLVTSQVLGVCLAAGARAAHGGEFTERAFLNGKMDLTQAEAVIDLIRAQTDLALRSATEQLEGRLGSAIRSLRDHLIELLAHLEASIDFPEEDIAPDEGMKLCARLAGVQSDISALLATGTRGRILREGVRAVIYGATNAGKSSLLNRLLGYERAIVSPIPGTTRDTIEEVINLRGIPIRLLDTAGLRESNDELEQAGMARTEQSLRTADLVLHLVDGSAPKLPDFRASGIAEILLVNKSDLPEHADWNEVDALRISCVAEEGLGGLEDAILARIGGDHVSPESAMAINLRHHDCLRRALKSCEQASATLSKRLSPEYVVVDVRGALAAITEVIAAESDDPVLDSLFANFCIGK
ncbi:MAG: tRNA uridine-5-carboxymethylaminomethyl(34) synthesis GTPase MnmE [Verrucomicrobiota bacterium]|nr:tRNA uridine-5-carboxymethylaminomethyl(34) synthesis GTPase MnmE [Verrucomicrobiota bacterium]